MGSITPSGYISIYDALKRFAKIDDYSEDELEWIDIGDRVNDAKALHEATKVLRQYLCDSELLGYFFIGDSKPHPVPEGIWTEDEACLERAGEEWGLEILSFFHHRGIEVNDVRYPVFLIEGEFEKLLAGKVNLKKVMAPKIKRKRGRPKGVGAFDDERWLDEIQKLVHSGMRPGEAANEILVQHLKEIQRNDSTTDQHVIDRLSRKYMDSDRLKDPPASD